jgi:hypothetical protein
MFSRGNVVPVGIRRLFKQEFSLRLVLTDIPWKWDVTTNNHIDCRQHMSVADFGVIGVQREDIYLNPLHSLSYLCQCN